MLTKHSIVTYAYHFISEAILLFFICIPIFYLVYGWIPYWIYLALVLGICTLFSLYSRTNNYVVYVFSTPIIMLLFYAFGFPLTFSIIIPALLTWRYTYIREGKVENKEMTYVTIALPITIVLVLFIKDIEIVIFAFVLFFILILGNIISHLTVIGRDNRKQFEHRLWFYIIGFFTLSFVTIFFLFDIFRNVLVQVWRLISTILVYLVGTIAGLILSFFDFKMEPFGEQFKLDGKMDGNFKDHLEGQGPSQIADFTMFIYWGAAIIIAGIILFIVVRTFKKRFKEIEQETVLSTVTYSDLTKNTTDKRNSIGKRLKGYFHRSNHPARKVVYQFERNAAKGTYGRHPFESIEEWLHRIHANTNIAVYQKVRYGELDVSEEELEQLKEELQQIETRLKERES